MESKIKTREEYRKILLEHPKVKALSKRKALRPKKQVTRRGAPKLLEESMQDKQIEMLVTAMRQIMKYHRNVGKLTRQRLKRRKISLNDELTLVKEGAKVEPNFRKMIKLACKVARSNPSFSAYASAIATRTNDMHVFANPAFLSQSELAIIKYMGIEPKELSNYFLHFYLPRRQKVTNVLTSGAFGDLLKKTENLADRLPFPEAPRYLIMQNIITLGGDGGAADYFVGGIAVVAGVVLILMGVPEVGIPLVIAGTASIAHEAAEDLGLIEDDDQVTIDISLPFRVSDSSQSISSSAKFGYALGNMSRSKLEIHVPSCPFLHLIHPRHLQSFRSVAEGQAAGLDNCHYCIGGSKR